MKPVARLVRSLVIVAFALSCNLDEAAAPDPALSLDHRGNDGGNPACRIGRHQGSQRGPVAFHCAIEIPSPLTGSQKGWAEQSNAKYFLSDASASGVHVINIRTHTYVGLIGGMAGAATTGGGTATTNGPGPNAFVSTPARGGGGGGRGHDDDDDDDGDRGHHGRRGPDRVLFVSDGNSTVHVVDMDRLRIIKSVSTALRAGAGVPDASVCDGGTATTHYCGRSNEINYDPEHHVVLVQNPSPLRLATPTVGGEGYATFISARYPYKVLGYVFPGAGTLEGHVWVPQLNRFLLPVQNPPGGVQHIAVINTRTRQIENRRVYTCSAIPGAGAAGNNNLQLAPGDNLWAQMCGRPIRMNVRTGAIKNVVTQIGTGDQDWYNPGDGNFYNTGAFPPGGPAHLGVMNGRTGAFLQAVSNPGGASPSAYAQTNEIFTRVPFTAANDAGSLCVVKGKGCVVVFAHTGTGGRNGDDDDDE